MSNSRFTEYDVYAHNAKMAAKSGKPVVGTSDDRESTLHGKVFEECRRRGWIALHGSMAHITHRTAGEPDFVILADNGRTIYVECKTAKGKLSIEQQAMAAHANKLGHTIHLVRSIEEFLAITQP